MSSQGEFRVAIYASEYKQICAWVLKERSLETGGDLFGLWNNDHTAVIQLVLGPGKDCQRTSDSFYQDVNYLEKVGSHLTSKEGLCHIGEWHSHHTIGLKRPSGGDERTVWTNMPKYGLSRFLLFIANIENRDLSASAGCFLFEFEKNTNKRKPVRQGKFVLLKNESPFRSRCRDVFAEDAECLNQEEKVGLLELSKKAISVPKERPVVTQRQPFDEERGGGNEDGRLSIPYEIRRRFSFQFRCVLLFKDDCDMILDLVRCRPTRRTGGDLFGLWTNDRESVLHIVTGQRRETVSSPQEVFLSNNASNDSRIEDLGARLRSKFRLSYLGKWQYMPRSKPTEAEIIATVGQNALFKGTGMRDFLLILASCDDQSSKVELNPYFLSRFSTTTRGEIADVLPRHSIFKEDDDIASIIDSLIDRGSFWEDNINRAGSPTKQRVEGNRKETEALDQRESYENQTSDKITSKSPETFRENSDPYLKLYMFHDHLQMIRDVVGCHPDAEAGGYLYGLWTNDGEPVLHRVTNNKNSATEIEISSEARYLECVGRWKYMSVCENIRSEMKSPQPDKRSSVFLMLEREEDQFMPSAFFLSDKSSFPRKMEIEVLDRKGAMKGEKFTDKDDRCEDTDHGERQPCCDLTVPEFNRFETGFACNPRELKVYLFQEDFEMMKDLVLRYPNVETGGDLFGLWTSDGDAVLHMVLGPGKNCKRTATSFYQDIPYLQEKGGLLTTKYMLCHIGEWHSHHQLHLYEPSHGDSSTVIRHYPHGTCGFLLIIANILSPDTVLLSPYLYTARSQYDFYQKGQLVSLPSRNAFKKATEIARTISEGQETWSNFQSGMIQYSHYNRLPQIPRTSDQFNARGISEGRGQGSNFQSGMAQCSQHPCLPQIAEASSQSTESRMESSNDNNDELMELD